MSALQQIKEGRKILPFHLIAQAVPMLTHFELAAITERLIERLDEIDGDSDLKDSNDQEAIDEREPDSHGGAGFWDIDQRFSIMNGQFMQNRNNVDDWPFR